MLEIKTNRNFSRKDHTAVSVTFANKMHSMECLRTTEPLFRTYEPSDRRTFGMKNLLFRTYKPSDYRTFGLESSHRPCLMISHQCHRFCICTPLLLIVRAFGSGFVVASHPAVMLLFLFARGRYRLTIIFVDCILLNNC